MFPRKHTISGKELMKSWNLGVHELSYLILKHDIIVLDASNLPKIKFSFNPNDYKIDSEKVLDIILNDPNSLSAMLFWLPDLTRFAISKDISSFKSKDKSEPASSTDEAFDLSKELSSIKSKATSKPRASTPDTGVRYSRRRPGNVRFRKAEPEKKEKVTTKPEKTIKNVIEDQEEEIRQQSNVFSLIGKVWFVKFKQQEWGLYPDQEKYKYIANVLNLPNNGYNTGDLEFSIYNTELVEKVKGVELTEEYQDDKTQEDVGDLNESYLSEILTSEEIKRFKKIGYELLEQLGKAKDAGDQELIDDVKMKIVKYRSYISNEYGIKTNISNDETKIHFKIHYRSSKENEKIRQRIKNQIKNAIKDFHDSLPMLRMHLDRSIKTKSYKTVYLPETHINWHISM